MLDINLASTLQKTIAYKTAIIRKEVFVYIVFAIMVSSLTDKIPYVKMHGTGNNFVIIDSRSTNNLEWSYREIANQNGCDQVIVITNSSIADCFMHIYNSDGSKVEMCGNAARWLDI